MAKRRSSGWLTPEARPSPELRRVARPTWEAAAGQFRQAVPADHRAVWSCFRGSGAGAGAEAGAGPSVGPRAGGLMACAGPDPPPKVRGRLPAASHPWGQALRRQGSWNRRAGACLRPVSRADRGTGRGYWRGEFGASARGLVPRPPGDSGGTAVGGGPSGPTGAGSGGRLPGCTSGGGFGATGSGLSGPVTRSTIHRAVGRNWQLAV